MNQLLDQVLLTARQLGASDVHLKVGLPPVFRIRGDLRTVRDMPPLNNDVVATFALNLMNEMQRASFEVEHDVDLAYGDAAGTRYRVNIYQQRGYVGMALRVIPPEVPTFDKLNLPGVVLKLADEERGMVLVTGATGSGKSTTMAAMVDYINSRRAAHIVTIEDPIEFIHSDKRSIINQRELGADTTTFSRALRAALRQDPDVILVGEMRDRDTMETALQAAETGHFVISTLHTVDAVETINRIVITFPPEQHSQIRLQLAAVIKGVISMRLVPRADGLGMIPATEVLVATNRVRDLIIAPERNKEILEAITSGRNPYGMISFDQCLLELVQAGLVTYDDALAHSTRPADFALAWRGIAAGNAADHSIAAKAAAGVAPVQSGQPPAHRPAPPAAKPPEVRPANAGIEIDRFGRK